MQATFTIILLMLMALIVIAAIAVGGWLIYRGFLNRSQGARAQEWPFVIGEVRESSVRTFTNAEETSYMPFVRYSYNVGGKEYIGSSLTPGLANIENGQERARRTVETYPVGSAVTVYYNPKDPADAVLEKRSGSSSASLIAGGLLWIVSLALVCLFIGLAIFGYISFWVD